MAWLILLFHVILAIAEATEDEMLAKPGCQEKCGAVNIPYPFGIGPNCSFSSGFELACNTTSRGMVPYHGDVEVLSITPATAQARLYSSISWQCYNSSSNKTTDDSWYFNLINTIYRLSSLDNMFIVIGCETLAFNIMWESDINGEYPYRTGCVSTCYNKESLTNGSCSGDGCCQTSIPSGINYYNVSFDKNYRSSGKIWDGHCSYAVIMETASFYFRTSYISTIDFWSAHNGTVPVVLDWSVGTETCKVAQANMSNYACVSNNSFCIDSTNGVGYVCNCSTGYQGNPYLPNGCKDIDECQDNSTCFGNICKNTPGSYNCSCPPGKQGDATIRNGCSPVAKNRSLSLFAKLAIGVSSGLFMLLLLLFTMHTIHERRKIIKIRETYFQQYGGRILLEKMKRSHGNSFNIFTEEELKKAANNFDENNMLGQGGNGTVYKGTLKSNEVVAIKRCKIINEKNKKEFGKEMLILSQINHINIVRILGCCLEVEIPILVYEFIPKGTLFDLLHSVARISLSIRLRIAQEAAEALAYLHSWASPPIVHCDVKSANILLDENYVAKVSDFGASALAPSDEDQFLTLVQGTRGYLDPQCIQTGQLTVKSDVYSFGVVLLELLTRKKPFYLDGLEERSLSSCFLTAMKENKLEEILDEKILDDENMKLIKDVAELARECLHMEGEKRPEMREVAERLHKLRKTLKHPWEQNIHDEIESLLGGPSSNLEFEMTSNHSLEKKAMLVMEIGR